MSSHIRVRPGRFTTRAVATATHWIADQVVWSGKSNYWWEPSAGRPARSKSDQRNSLIRTCDDAGRAVTYWATAATPHVSAGLRQQQCLKIQALRYTTTCHLVVIDVSEKHAAYISIVQKHSKKSYLWAVLGLIRPWRYETVVPIYQLTRRHIPEDLNLHQNRHENLKFRKRLTSTGHPTSCTMGTGSTFTTVTAAGTSRVKRTSTPPHVLLIARSRRCHDVTELTRVTQPLLLCPSSADGRADLMAPRSSTQLCAARYRYIGAILPGVQKTKYCTSHSRNSCQRQTPRALDILSLTYEFVGFGSFRLLLILIVTYP